MQGTQDLTQPLRDTRDAVHDALNNDHIAKLEKKLLAQPVS